MAVYEQNVNWYMKGKVRNEDGTRNDYKRLITDKSVNGKKKALKYEQAWKEKYNEDLEQFQSGSLTVIKWR